MSAENDAKTSPLDWFKWLVVTALLGGAVVGNYMYSDFPILYRVLGVVALMLAGLGLAVTTEKGAAFWQLLKEANIERRKVVWPTRQETTQTTLIVVAFVFVAALVLWGPAPWGCACLGSLWGGLVGPLPGGRG